MLPLIVYEDFIFHYFYTVYFRIPISIWTRIYLCVYLCNLYKFTYVMLSFSRLLVIIFEGKVLFFFSSFILWFFHFPSFLYLVFIYFIFCLYVIFFLVGSFCIQETFLFILSIKKVLIGSFFSFFLLCLMVIIQMSGIF